MRDLTEKEANTGTGLPDAVDTNLNLPAPEADFPLAAHDGTPDWDTAVDEPDDEIVHDPREPSAASALDEPVGIEYCGEAKAASDDQDQDATGADHDSFDLSNFAVHETDLSPRARVVPGGIACRRPTNGERVYVFDEPPRPVMLLQGSTPNDFFLLDRNLLSKHRALAVPVGLHRAATLSGRLLLIPIVLRRRTGGLDRSHRSLAEQIESAKGKWVTFHFERKPKDGRRGCEILITAQTNAPAAPALPEKSLEDMFRGYFRDRLINTEDHPVLQAAIERTKPKSARSRR